MDIVTEPTRRELGPRAAAAGAALMRAALAERGSANIIVATGSSQFEMLTALAAEPGIRWDRVTGFHLDEYVGLPVTHPASFRSYLWQRFVSRLPLPLAAFHYVGGDAADPRAECDRLGRLAAAHPVDVAFIGIGENAHVAFNDPPADFDAADPYLVVDLDDACRRQQQGEGWFPTMADVPTRAISMSVRQIMNSRAIVCTVPDARKADAVRASVRGPVTPAVPASILQRHEATLLFLGRRRRGRARVMAAAFDLQVNGYAGVDFNAAGPDRRRPARRLRGPGPGRRRRMPGDGHHRAPAGHVRPPAAAGRSAGGRRAGPAGGRRPPRRGALHQPRGRVSRGPPGPDAIRPAEVDAAERLLDAGGGLVRLVTLAPEQDAGLRTTARLAAPRGGRRRRPL